MIIGLTGGIGSGKSTVARIFGAMGCTIYNSDERARAVYFEAPVRAEVLSLLGPEAYKDVATLNTAYIASKVFEDKVLLDKLNGIIHPAVKQDLARFMAEQPAGAIIVKETALLFETGLYRDMDLSVLVVAPEALRVERVMKRSGLGREAVLSRMSSQWPDAQKMKLADRIITNDGQSPVIPQVAGILHAIRQTGKR